MNAPVVGIIFRVRRVVIADSCCSTLTLVNRRGRLFRREETYKKRQKTANRVQLYAYTTLIKRLFTIFNSERRIIQTAVILIH